jgi:NitT/TauT family transport system substrate-binding protein
VNRSIADRRDSPPWLFSGWRIDDDIDLTPFPHVRRLVMSIDDRFPLRFGLGLCVCLLVGGCGGAVESSPNAGSSPANSTTAAVAVQLNWYPEAEHGGVFQAAADGSYRDVGLEVEIRPGGRATPVAPELELGRVQFAFANADDVVIYRRQGMDIVAVLAAMQDSPRCILVREDSGVESFEGLAGMTLQRQAGRPFLEFMRSQGILDQVQEVPYHGSVSSLVGDPSIAIQAYSFAEPLLAEQQGVKVRRLMVSDLGWNPYSSVLITTGTLIREQPELVRQFVQATCLGWQHYLTDPTLGNESILAANEHGMTAEALDFGSRELKSLVMPGDTPLEQIGEMSLERWQQLVQQMDAIDPNAAGKVKPEECFTTEFLPTNASPGVGPAND